MPPYGPALAAKPFAWGKMRQREPLCFDAEPKQQWVTIERSNKRCMRKLGQLRLAEDGIVHQPRLAALADQLDAVAQRYHRELL